MNRKILIISDYYLPGFKGGGPLRTIANMVGWLGDDFDFHILTTDRDLGDDGPYTDIETGCWHTMGKAQVRYLRSDEMSFSGWYDLLNTIDYDLVYLNSFFSGNSVKIMLLRRLKQLPKRQIILAPRGEFHPGALAIKSYKKRPYLFLARWLYLYQNIIWQASDIAEAKTIYHHFQGATVEIAPNLPLHPLPPQLDITLNAKTIPTRLVFISRISPKKNLEGALKILKQVKVETVFDIYGPTEDKAYWQHCQQLIASLPTNIQVRYCGTLHPDTVIPTFAQYHLFLFPTQGENYGHVIWEALYAGCLVLTSDQTPWKHLETNGIGWAVPRQERARFVEIIHAVSALDEASFHQMAFAAQQFAVQSAVNKRSFIANRRLFMG